MSAGGFNWDSDYEDLVKERHLRVLPPEGENAPVDKPVRATLSRAFFPALVCAVVIGGYTMLGPKIFGQGSGAQTASLFPAMQLIDQGTSFPRLQAYSDSQSRIFLQGLARFSDADLLIYAETTRRDLTRAGTMLAPFMRDALALTEHELTRRAVPVPPAFGLLEDVRIDQKLSG
jgi:hypothetical protein